MQGPVIFEMPWQLLYYDFCLRVWRLKISNAPDDFTCSLFHPRAAGNEQSQARNSNQAECSHCPTQPLILVTDAGY